MPLFTEEHARAVEYLAQRVLNGSHEIPWQPMLDELQFDRAARERTYHFLKEYGCLDAGRSSRQIWIIKNSILELHERIQQDAKEAKKEQTPDLVEARFQWFRKSRIFAPIIFWFIVLVSGAGVVWLVLRIIKALAEL